MVEYVETDLTRLKINSIALAVSILLFEVLIFIMYGLFMRYPLTGGDYDHYGVGLLFCVLVMLTVGFALLLSYIRSNSWSGVGYPLFMLAITVQLYFLISAFLTKIRLQPSSENIATQGASFIELTPFYAQYGSSFSGALNCALAVYVSYTAFHGRVGTIEVFFHTIVTVIGYEVNRQTMIRIGVTDNGGSMGIFIFGSMAGMIVSWIITIFKRHHTKDHRKYRAERINSLYAMLGASFIWALIPVLNSLATLTQTNKTISNPFVGFAAINTWFALSASTWAAFCMSIILHKRLSAHDIIFGSFSVVHCLTQGAIAFGSSSNLVSSPIAAIVVGLLSGVIAVTMLSYLQRYMNRRGVLDTNGFVPTFLLSGLQGGIWSAVFTVFINEQQYYTSGFSFVVFFDVYTQGGLQIAGIFVSVVIGCITGFFSVGLIRGMNHLNVDDYFDDGLSWTIEDDGLYNDYHREEE